MVRYRWVTEDGRYLLIATSRGSDNSNRLYLVDLGDPKKPKVKAAVRPLVETDNAEFGPFGSVGPVLFLRTDRGAPNRKIIGIDVRRPAEAEWKTIVPGGPGAIENVALLGGRIVVEDLEDVKSRLALFDLDGKRQADVPLPGQVRSPVSRAATTRH